MSNKIEKLEKYHLKRSRQTIIKQSLKLTTREKLMVLEELNKLSQKIFVIKKRRISFDDLLS